MVKKNFERLTQNYYVRSGSNLCVKQLFFPFEIKVFKSNYCDKGALWNPAFKFNESGADCIKI